MAHELMIGCRRVGRRTAILWTILALCARAQTLVPDGESRFVYDLSSQRVPVWTAGFLVPIQNNDLETPVIHLIDEAGSETAPIAFSFPGTKAMRILSVSRGADGTLALSGQAYDAAGKGGGFISWISQDRQKVTTIQTFPYNPENITIAPDGTTWTQGYESINGVESDPGVNRKNGVIRRFDGAGKLIGSYIPRSSIPGITGQGINYGKLASNKDHIGWYVSYTHQYFELTFDGDNVVYAGSYTGIASRNNPHSHATGLVIMENGDVYLSAAHNGRPATDQVYRLDRSSRAWIPVTMPAGADGTPILKHPCILGGGGNRLALLGGAQKVIFLSARN